MLVGLWKIGHISGKIQTRVNLFINIKALSKYSRKENTSTLVLLSLYIIALLHNSAPILVQHTGCRQLMSCAKPGHAAVPSCLHQLLSHQAQGGVAGGGGGEGVLSLTGTF